MSARQVVLDTETTGLDVTKGHRIIEIGCIELVERRPTGRHFHRYLNPGRDIEAGAAEVTGLTLEFLADKPVFASVAEELIEFIRGAELIIHNAAFDVGFLDQELGLCGASVRRVADCARVTDTLAMARERFPGKRNSLDALCSRLEVDNRHRKLHGALLDAELLAEVYLAMTAGQGDLALTAAQADGAGALSIAARIGEGARPIVRRASAEEIAVHARALERLEKIAGDSIWSRWLSPPATADAGEPSGGETATRTAAVATA
jgi:DNA polymerase-3 subunit epsilon